MDEVTNTTTLDLDPNNFSDLTTFIWILRRVKCEERRLAYSINFFAFFVEGVMLGMVCGIGIIGNTLSLLVLRNQGLGSSSSGIHVFLMALTLCDLAKLGSSIVLNSVPVTCYYFCQGLFFGEVIHTCIFNYLFAFSTIVQLASVYMTVGITVERYIAICYPLRSRSICTPGRAKWVSGFILTFAIGYNVPIFWEMESIPIYLKGELVACDSNERLMLIPEYRFYYVFLGSLVIFRVIPFCILVTLNVGIWKQVRAMTRLRSVLTQSQRNEISVAKMMLCIVLTFVGLNLITILSHTPAFEDDGTFRSLSNLLSTSVSSINYIFYCLFGKKFRSKYVKILKSVFCLDHKGQLGRDHP